MFKIISQADKEVAEFNKEIEITPGYTFNQAETLRKIDLYYASKYVKGDTDKERFKKLFYNIVKSRVNTATKAVDIDTKDIRIIAEDGQSYWQALLFEMDLKQEMKEEKYGEFFNEISEKWPRYGAVVVKDVKGVPKMVQLKNLILDQAIDYIKNSPHVLEKHAYDFDEFRDLASQSGWENTEKVIELYRKMGKVRILVVERYGYAKQSDFDDPDKPVIREKDEYIKAMFLIAGLEFIHVAKKKEEEEMIQPIIIFKKKAEKWPYRDLHWDKEEGRWLPVGVVEDLFNNQEGANEARHLQRKAMYWASRKVFRTKDKTAPKNLFSETNNGDVLATSEPIEQVNTGDRNLPLFDNEINRIEKNSDERAFSYEVNTGEGLPSGTPFRLGALLANAVNSHFAFKREKLGLFIKEIIFDFVIPGFKAKKSKSHVLNFDGSREQIEKVSEILINAHMWKYVQDYYGRTGKYPTLTQYDFEKAKLQDEISKRNSLFVEIPDGFYDDLKFRIDIDITGESKNFGAELETLGNIFTIVARNPAVLDDPRLRSLLEMIANRAGQNPDKLFGSFSRGSQLGLTGVGVPGGGPVEVPQFGQSTPTSPLPEA